LGQQNGTPGERFAMAECFDVNGDSAAVWIVDRSGNVTDLIADFENHFGGRIVAEFWLVKLQPKPLRALPEGDDSGLGKVSDCGFGYAEKTLLIAQH
jgi:hypothetical protein